MLVSVCGAMQSEEVVGPTLNYTPGKYPSKSIFNNVIMSHIYSFCRLSDYFWSVHIKFWIIVVGGGSSSEFNISCNVGAGQLSNRVPPYVYYITMQASIRISIRPNSGSPVPPIVRSIWTILLPLLLCTTLSQQAGVPAAGGGVNMPIPHTVI